jgi:predicted dinucleotide-binding enzyme
VTPATRRRSNGRPARAGAPPRRPSATRWPGRSWWSNATAGAGSLPALESAADEHLDGKVIIDISNPLDFSRGFPPSLSVCNTDSLAEQIQRRFPRARVVKALNTVNAAVMVDPTRVPGDSDIFVAGDDPAAKAEVTALLTSFGWKDGNVVDVGGISAARGLEMYLPLWLNLMQGLGTADFNIKIVR